MAVLPWQPGQCPYVTPDQLYSPSASASQWPTGVQWGSLPGMNVSAEAQFAVLAMLCKQATTRAETILGGMPLRSTLTTEQLEGPHFRVTVQRSSSNGRILTSRWPVMAVTDVSVCPNGMWPRQFTSLPAGTFEPEFPVQSLYGTTAAVPGEGAQSIIIQPGWINWRLGRQGWRVKFTYYAGWPHATITQAAVTGDTTLHVDDCTGWAPPPGSTTGAAGVIYDALGGGQETISCTAASAVTGPGTLTLASALAYDHAPGIMASAMPENAIWASALLAGAAALARGATATTVQSTGGRQVTGRSLDQQAKELLSALKRTE